MTRYVKVKENLEEITRDNDLSVGYDHIEQAGKILSIRRKEKKYYLVNVPNYHYLIFYDYEVKEISELEKKVIEVIDSENR